MSRGAATLTGFVAVLLWALLALFTVATAPVPPFQLNALTFAIAGLAGLVWTAASGRLGVLARVPVRVVAFGTLGLFGYHALYFSALRLAPPAEASLIAYLWPLLIVVFSGLLLREPLRPGHLIGALMGLGGAALVIAGRGDGLGFQPALGHLLAFGCALTWSLYSVLSRRLGAVPTEAVTLYCLATAALSLPAHLVFETTAWPQGATGWLAVAGLGLGPVGLAFFVWDLGVKRGDIRLLGATSYAAPVLSTLILVIAGHAQAGLRLVLAVALITGGALAAWRASASGNAAAKTT
jgi:drug/metabolite transporter (DMT)-like permease